MPRSRLFESLWNGASRSLALGVGAITLMMLAGACSSSPRASDNGRSPASGGGDSTASGGTTGSARSSIGEISVTWKNLDARHAAVTHTIVNEGSEAGRALIDGTKTSTEVRVASEVQMTQLLERLDDIGFFDHATPGMTKDNMPRVGSRRGVVLVTRNGKHYGLMLTTGLGNTPIPTAYTRSKQQVVALHASLQGLAAGAKADRVFKVPGIQPE